MPEKLPAQVVFSLVCENCDSGTGIESSAAAIAAGWTGIQFAPDLPMANFIGLCPACRAEEFQVDKD